jgi:hypothetical protein
MCVLFTAIEIYYASIHIMLNRLSNLTKRNLNELILYYCFLDHEKSLAQRASYLQWARVLIKEGLENTTNPMIRDTSDTYLNPGYNFKKCRKMKKSSAVMHIYAHRTFCPGPFVLMCFTLCERDNTLSGIFLQTLLPT